MERVILHCDLNNFFASVECKENPSLSYVPMAVAGSVEERTGIILAKNNRAKQFGVVTGEAIWQAKKKCPLLATVPPHFEKYIYYSNEAYKIYQKYTDQIESFGIDECWLDVTGSINLFGSGYKIANDIRLEIKEKLGITVSVGVSFNKIFSKLGSDMKKPDAITVIDEGFKNQIWKLPANSLLGVGRATFEKLKKAGIYTIGDIARSDYRYLVELTGKNGLDIWKNANGFENSPVLSQCFKNEPKSIGKSMTCIKDIQTKFDFENAILYLSDCISAKLRQQNKRTSLIVLGIKTPNFEYSEHCLRLGTPCYLSYEISRAVISLYEGIRQDYPEIRSVGIRASNLTEMAEGAQLSLFSPYGTDKIAKKQSEKKNIIESNMNKIKHKYGSSSITRATFLIPNNTINFNK